MLYSYNEITTEKTPDSNNYPITKDEAKRHCHVDKDFNQDDAYITQLIRACTREAEAFIGKDIAYTLNEVNMYDYIGQYVQIWEGNYNTLVSIVDDSSTSYTPEETFPFYNYIQFKLANSISSDPLNVKFYTGWTQPNCPENIKLAIMLRVKDYYDVHRSSESSYSISDTKSFERLLAPFKNTTP